jgi:hypothetical protein
MTDSCDSDQDVGSSIGADAERNVLRAQSCVGVTLLVCAVAIELFLDARLFSLLPLLAGVALASASILFYGSLVRILLRAPWTMRQMAVSCVAKLVSIVCFIVAVRGGEVRDLVGALMGLATLVPTAVIYAMGRHS